MKSFINQAQAEPDSKQKDTKLGRKLINHFNDTLDSAIIHLLHLKIRLQTNKESTIKPEIIIL